MSRKHYVAIARAIKLAGTVNTTRGHRAGRYDTARLICEALAQENPRFDRDRFMAACDVATKVPS